MLRKETMDGKEIHIIEERTVSNNPDDHYLSIVLAFIPKQNEYVTWLRNKSLGGYHSGHYFWNDEEAAYDDYYNR